MEKGGEEVGFAKCWGDFGGFNMFFRKIYGRSMIGLLKAVSEVISSIWRLGYKLCGWGFLGKRQFLVQHEGVDNLKTPRDRRFCSFFLFSTVFLAGYGSTLPRWIGIPRRGGIDLVPW